MNLDRIPNRTLLATLGLGLLAGLVSCTTAPEAPLTAERLEPYSCGDVQRIHTLGGVFLASQPGPEDLKHASEGGIKTVVTLRQDDEIDWDEKATVEALGMEFHSLPFKAPGELSDAVLDEVRGLLRDESKRPLLLHCSSANRAGAVWLAHRVLDGGLAFEAAEAEATTVGLKLPAYSERVREYVAARSAAPSTN